jgi:GGDEF domain-containing protein
MESDVGRRQNSATAPARPFIDIAGFSAIADIFGDAVALHVLEVFESMVRDDLSGYEPPIKWIGDEAILSFPEPDTATSRPTDLDRTFSVV